MKRHLVKHTIEYKKITLSFFWEKTYAYVIDNEKPKDLLYSGYAVDCTEECTLEFFIKTWKDYIDKGVLNFPECLKEPDSNGFYIP